MVSEVVPAAELMTRARALAAELAKVPPLTARYTRAVFTQPMREALTGGVALGLALEGISATDFRNQQ